MKILRIVIADDHDLIRRGVRTLLESRADWEICGEAHTGREAVEQAGKLRPDVVVLDISMPDLNGIDAAKRIRKEAPEAEILILSAHYTDQFWVGTTEDINQAKTRLAQFVTTKPGIYQIYDNRNAKFIETFER